MANGVSGKAGKNRGAAPDGGPHSPPGTGERRRVVEVGKDAELTAPGVHALFAEQAARTPDAVAVASGDQALTYAGLDARANRLARHLAGLGVGVETRAGICLQRGPELVVAILAVLKAGGAYVPLDPGYPPERLAFMLADAGVEVLLTQESLRPALPAAPAVRVVSVDGDRAAIERESADAVNRAVAPHGLAYVMYTSGSTGTPKGVAVEHRGIVRLVRGADYARFGPGETVLQAAPVSFDASTLEVWGALLNGGRLVLAPENAPSLEELGRTIATRGVTTLWLTAGLFGAMVEERLDDFAGVRQLLAGGDVLPVEQVRKVRARFPQLRLINGYGPTENTTFTCCHTVDARWDGGPVPIGTPISGTRVYVLDTSLRPVEAGEAGELFAGGEGVARGYLNRPAQTAERFVPDPFAPSPGTRMYRTGDRARTRADGAVEFLGRVDEQVKIRGFRIEPGEVETALARHPAVRACAVVARDDAAGGRRLVAYVVGDADAVSLRAHLLATLPEHMVPGVYVALPALPLTPNGKVDRAALPAPDAADEDFVAPRTPAEEALAAIWREVLAVERVSVERPFLQMGGDSLRAMRVLARVSQQFGVALPPRLLFTSGTIAQVAAALEAPAVGQEAPDAPELGRVPRVPPIPLSFQQESAWFLEQLAPGQLAYRTQAIIRLRGPLDVPVLERSMEEMIRRHESLRTTFPVESGGPVQRIHAPWRVHLPIIDLTAVPVDGREAAIREAARAEFLKPIDTAALPLVLWTLLRLDGQEHVLTMVEHHFVHDGWSFGLFFRELRALYMAFLEGKPSPLAQPEVQFADFARWQRRWMESAEAQASLRVLESQLAGVPPLVLPTDHPRPAVLRFAGTNERIPLTPALAAEARAFSQAHGVTFFATLFATFQALMGRYAGQADFCVGSGVANRGQVALEGVIGMVVNSVPVRADLSGDPTGLELLRRVQDRVLRAYEHQRVPFDQVVRRVQPERTSSQLPLAQVFFSFHDSQMPDPAFGPLRVELQEAQPNGSSKFDLQVIVIPRAAPGGDGEVVMVWEYNTDLFVRETVLRAVRHFEALLAGLVRHPHRPLSAIPLLDDQEQRQVLEEWNRTAAPYPHAGIAALFQAQAAATPDAVALVSADETVTYAELNRRANRLARHLARRGVGLETRVGICLERGPGLVVAILAVLKAGGAYVPLDPGYPPERLAFMLADAGVEVLLTQASLRGALPAAPERVVELDAAAAEIAAEDADDPEPRAGAGALAYVMYTSGSTGTPRGVAVEQRSVVRLVRGADFAALGADETILQAAPVSFDAATLEIWGALLNGGRLVLVPGSAPSLEELGRVITTHGVTTLWLTAGLFQAMVEQRLDDFAGVRQLLTGGDVLPVEAVRKVRERFPALRLINGYGPTENTTFTCCHTVDARWDGGPVPIGTPIGNTRVYVLDGGMRPAPVGVPGELYAGGDGVARGYLNRVALTAARFVPDPFSSSPGARMYRTGDRARWRADGTVEFLGRVDEQVKLRGFRIEPGEIETVLRRHPGVVDCTVVAREHRPGDRRLVAYVVGDADAASLRAHLLRALPDYMVPAAFVALDALPLTRNGKVDRAALPAPDYDAGGRYVAPRTPTEEVLAEIWAGVLGVARVGVHDDFFALGGHSLLATRVVSRIRAVLGVELPLRAHFAGPTVAGLAEAVEALRRGGRPQLPPVVPVGREGPLPLSFAQERLWFLDRLQPHGAAYTVATGWRLSGALDVSALERALGEIVRRHEALRTTFRETDGAPVQVVAPFAGFALAVEDLSGLDGVARDAVVRRRTAQDAASSFDLAAGPLFRAALLKTGEHEHVLLLAMHHIASDEWSLGVLFRELGALYGAYAGGGQPALPALAVQYADFAAWQREQLRGEPLERELAWWKERLAGAPALLELPTDHPRPAVHSGRGATERMELSAELLERLRALARGEGATLFMVALAAWQVLLAKYASTADVVVGSPVAGRTRRETEALIGFFVNTLVLRTDLSGDPAFREAVGRVREATLGAFEHQELPFEQLVAALQPERSRGHAPLFQVAFVLEGADRAGADLPGITLRRVNAERETSKFDLTLFVAPHGPAPAAALEYSTDLFEPATVRRMLQHFARVLEQVAEDADRPLSRIRLLGAGERARVVGEWNRTDFDYPAEAGVHELFQRQAARAPGAVAVAWDGGSLTYAELNARANRLAYRLRALGVRPGARVALLLPRSADLVAAELAVLKAGAAYVPIDPAFPAERVALMVANSGARVVLARGGDAHPPLAEAVRLDVDAVADGPEHDLPAVPGGGAPAYVMYTSGSTGTPKGVMVPHRAISRLVVNNGFATFGADDCVAFAANPTFDASTLEVWAPLLNGGRLAVIPPDQVLDPRRLGDALGRHGVTVLWLTVGLFNAFAGELGAAFGRLRVLLVGGDRLDPATIARQLRDHPPGRLLNGYGPTETTTFALTHPVEQVADGAPGIPLGRPIGNTRVYLLDAAGEPVPVGVPGEIHVGGDGVALGYLGRPALTAERFVPDAFGPAGARMYRTGDRGRWLPDGTVEFLGRTDMQVKIRGFRVEPAEVEARLAEHPAVRHAVVMVREDTPGDRRLAAYVVAAEGAAAPAAEALRAHLAARLPEHMVPAAFVALAALPLTPNGKVDRAALPAPEREADEDAFVAPSTPAEIALAEIWAEVLGLERVGVHDSFFALGGHSLLATRVVSRIRERMDGEVGVGALFENPTIHALAPRLTPRRADPTRDAATASAASTASPHLLLASMDELSEEELDRLLGLKPDTGLNA
jgi:amino acid adenylation domain-containing protein